MAVTVLAEADPTVLFTSTPRPGGTDRGSAIRDAVTYLDPDSTDVSVFDLGLLRGDGVFEAIRAAEDDYRIQPEEDVVVPANFPDVLPPR